MTYLSSNLTFESDKITYVNSSNQTLEVMMDWEDTIMSASAAYACEGGGDILEIGFGMGISATYIQAHTINSHTIIENHPQVILKAQAWAAVKPNVTIMEEQHGGVVMKNFLWDLIMLHLIYMMLTHPQINILTIVSITYLKNNFKIWQ